MRLSIIVLLLALAVPAFARQPNPRLVVVELVPDSGAKDGNDPALAAFATALSAELRNAVRDKYKVVEWEDKDNAARFCLTKKPACWASIATEAKAKFLIYGVVRKQGQSYQIVINKQRQDTLNKTVTRAVPSTTKTDLDLLAKELVMKLHGLAVPQTR